MGRGWRRIAGTIPAGIAVVAAVGLSPAAGAQVDLTTATPTTVALTVTPSPTPTTPRESLTSATTAPPLSPTTVPATGLVPVDASAVPVVQAPTLATTLPVPLPAVQPRPATGPAPLPSAAPSAAGAGAPAPVLATSARPAASVAGQARRPGLGPTAGAPVPGADLVKARRILTARQLRAVAGENAKRFAFPFALGALVGAFLLLQHRFGEGDARLLAAPVDDDLRTFS